MVTAKGWAFYCFLVQTKKFKSDRGKIKWYPISFFFLILFHFHLNSSLSLLWFLILLMCSHTTPTPPTWKFLHAVARSKIGRWTTGFSTPKRGTSTWTRTNINVCRGISLQLFTKKKFSSPNHYHHTLWTIWWYNTRKISWWWHLIS